MKDKILAAIKAKFPAVNLSKKRLDAIVAKLETKITEESQIDAQIDAFNDFNPIADLAKNDDTIADLKGKLKTAATPLKEKDKDDTTTAEVELPADTPAYVKLILDSNKKLEERLGKMEGEKTQATIRGKAEAALKEVPVSYWGKRPVPEKEEELEAFVKDVQTDYTAFKQEMTDAGLSVLSVPRTATGGAGAAEGKIDPSLKAFLEKQNAEAVQLQQKPSNGFIQNN